MDPHASSMLRASIITLVLGFTEPHLVTNYMFVTWDDAVSFSKNIKLAAPHQSRATTV